MNEEAPKRTGKPAEELDLTGKHFPWGLGLPCFLSMPGTDALYLPCFTDPEKLCEVMAQAKAHFTGVKTIEDGPEFLSSIPTTGPGGVDVHVILDPYYTPEGKVRFKQVLRG